jgi:L-threonylcarbamoyladenylate synthase
VSPANQVVSVERDGAAAARAALEATVAGGGVAVFPADGLYGLACDPLNAGAIARIHELKGRDEGKPSAVMYFSRLVLRELIRSLDEGARTAIAALLPGPVTLVVANPEHRYPLACRDDPERLGLRLIEGSLAGAACPVFQTSANRSGEPPAARLGDVADPIRAGADLVIDGGELTGEPSTVVDVTAINSGRWTILREGALSADRVAASLEG